MTTSDLDALAERLDRLEEIVALIATRQGNGRVLGDPAMRALGGEVRERARARYAADTPLCQFTGLNRAAVQEFVGGAATVREDDTSAAVLWLIQNGHSTRVRAGTWLAKEPDTGRVYATTSPTE